MTRTAAMVVRLVSCALLLTACSAPSGPAVSRPLPEQTTSAVLPEHVGPGPTSVPRRQLWQGTTGAQPDIDGGVIVGATVGAVQEADARTGRLRWRVRYGPDEPLVESFVVGAGTVVLAVTRDRSRPPAASLDLPEALLAVDLETGRRLWTRRIPPLASQTGTATIVGPNLVLAGYSGQVTALDARTGVQRWTAGPGPRSPACPSRSFGNVQLAGPGPLLLVALQCPQTGALVQRLDPRTGRVQWAFPLDKNHIGGTPTAALSAQAQADGTVFAVADTFNPGRDFDVDVLHVLLPAAPNTGNTGGRILLALDAATGHLRWAAPSPAEYVSTGAGTVCSFDTQTYQCRDSRTGHLTVPPPDGPLPQRSSSYGEAPLAQSGPLIFIVTAGPHPALKAIDTRTGATVGQTPLHVSDRSAPYATVVAAGAGLVLIRRGDQEPFDALAYTDTTP